MGGGARSAWHYANLTWDGGASPRVSVSFDSGVTHTGLLNAPHDDLASWSDGSAWYYQPPALAVHFVPHSHNDPGWLKTYWELLMVAHPGINDFAVLDIYSAVVAALAESPTRTFATEITVFWSDWWAQANGTMRAAAAAAVATGALEFTGSGWTQNDEAITRFEDSVDQARGAPRV